MGSVPLLASLVHLQRALPSAPPSPEGLHSQGPFAKLQLSFPRLLRSQRTRELFKGDVRDSLGTHTLQGWSGGGSWDPLHTHKTSRSPKKLQ